jgi:hypothetical protein
MVVPQDAEGTTLRIVSPETRKGEYVLLNGRCWKVHAWETDNKFAMNGRGK